MRNIGLSPGTITCRAPKVSGAASRQPVPRRYAWMTARSAQTSSPTTLPGIGRKPHGTRRVPSAGQDLRSPAL